MKTQIKTSTISKKPTARQEAIEASYRIFMEYMNIFIVEQSQQLATIFTEAQFKELTLGTKKKQTQKDRAQYREQMTYFSELIFDKEKVAKYYKKYGTLTKKEQAIISKHMSNN
jgi:hypothetical protein